VLEQASGKPVKAIMASFTKQQGYPVVSARRRGNSLELSQRRFLADGSTDKSGKRWSVSYRWEGSGENETLLWIAASQKDAA